MSLLHDLQRRFGPYRGPTQGGWLNFCHARCGDKRFRFGISLKDRRYRCFNCGFKGPLKKLGVVVPRHILLPMMRTQETRSRLPIAPSKLPWRPITPGPGKPGILERKALRFLKRRGVGRIRAAQLRIGYGIRPPYGEAVVHPWYREDGELGGWQARRLYDPNDGSSKVIDATPVDFPPLWTPRQGALYLYEYLEEGDSILIVEGPYDALSGRRVHPTVALMGSDIHAAQIRRLQKKHPPEVIYGLDPDTWHRTWLEQDGKWDPESKARRNLRRLYLAFPRIRVIQYPKNFKGDIGGKPNKAPHSSAVIAKLIADAVPYDPTE